MCKAQNLVSYGLWVLHNRRGFYNHCDSCSTVIANTSLQCLLSENEEIFLDWKFCSFDNITNLKFFIATTSKYITISASILGVSGKETEGQQWWDHHGHIGWFSTVKFHGVQNRIFLAFYRSEWPWKGKRMVSQNQEQTMHQKVTVESQPRIGGEDYDPNQWDWISRDTPDHRRVAETIKDTPGHT